MQAEYSMARLCKCVVATTPDSSLLTFRASVQWVRPGTVVPLYSLRCVNVFVFVMAYYHTSGMHNSICTHFQGWGLYYFIGWFLTRGKTSVDGLNWNLPTSNWVTYNHMCVLLSQQPAHCHSKIGLLLSLLSSQETQDIWKWFFHCSFRSGYKCQEQTLRWNDGLCGPSWSGSLVRFSPFLA